MILSLAILLNLLVICDALQIRWNRPRLIEKGAEISNFANGPESFNGLHKLVGISVCSSPEIKANPGASYRWTFTNSTGKNVGGKTENSCSTTWYAPMEGKYTVKAEMTVGGKMIATTQTVLDVRDLWFVLIGDSFVSGEGCPITRANIQAFKTATWLSTVCHRSNNSYGYITYNSIVSKYPNYGHLFTYLACSGASIQTGLLGPYLEPAQIGVIKDIQKSVITNCVCPGCCKTKPDLIVFSIGGNDMEFSNTIKALVFNVAQNEFSQAPARLKQLQLRFDKLSEAFKDIGTSPAGIFFVEYFDLVKNSKGYSDTSCGVVGQADSYNFDLAETQIRKPMNDIIVAVCQKNNWTYIQGIDTLFLAHGVCSSDAYIGSVTDSLSIQGDWNGAFHPNYKGHQLIAPIVWRNVSQYLTKIMYNI